MEVIDRIVSVYAQLDQQVAEFQMKTGLRCTDACGGVCCPTSRVSATLLEMIPAAHQILTRGEGMDWIDRIHSEPNNRCIFYSQDKPDGTAGHCTNYPLRPAVCRLFGFATVRNRLGKRVLSVCSYLAKTAPDAVVCAQLQQDEAPCLSDVGIRMYGLAPSLGMELMPINQALEKAIYRLGIHMQMAYGETLGGISAA